MVLVDLFFDDSGGPRLCCAQLANAHDRHHCLWSAGFNFLVVRKWFGRFLNTGFSLFKH